MKRHSIERVWRLEAALREFVALEGSNLVWGAKTCVVRSDRRRSARLIREVIELVYGGKIPGTIAREAARIGYEVKH